MSNLTKKITSVVLSATTAVWISGFAMLVPVAQAQSLQSQIDALLAQIAALQSQLASQGGSPSTYVACNFTRDLTLGVKGDDVMCLQKYLNDGGNSKVAASGPGSFGSETTYFGPLTASAVAKWQAANGVTPPAGYFGKISRAKYSSLLAAAPAPSPVPGPTPTPTPAPVPSGSGLTVTLSSNQPSAGLFGESFASREFTKLSFTASADGDVTVKSMTVERTGQGQDAVFNGVIALDENGLRMGDAKTFGSDHRLKLTQSFTVKAGQTKSITLAGDSDSDQNDYNGQLVSLSLVSVDAGTANINAAYPLTGTVHTVNSTLAVGSLTVERGALDPGSNLTKEIGTKAYIFAALKLTAGSNEDISLKSVQWNQSSSAAKTDLENIKIYLDGVAYDTMVSDDGKYYTAKFGTGVTIAKGLNKEIYVKGDIASGSNRGVDFDLYRYADIRATGMTYGYDVLPSGTDSGDSSTDDDGTLQNSNPNYDAYEATIGSGTVSVEPNTAVTAQNVAENLADQILGGFIADVKGEDITVAAMNFDASLTEAAGTGSSIDTNDVTNITLVDDNGKVVAGPVDGVAGGNNAIRFTDTVRFAVGRHAYTLKGKFGTDVSLNDQFSASTTPSSDWSTVRGATSNQTITPTPASAVTMSTMTIKTGDLRITMSQDTATTSPDLNVVKGTSGVTIEKYVLDASNSGEDLRVTSMQFDLITSYPANTADDLTNCQLWDGSTALNTGTNIVNPTNTNAAGDDITFTLDGGLVIPKGTVKTLALKCNFIAGGTTEFVGFSLANLTTAANQAVVTGITSGTTVAETVTSNSGRTIVAQTSGTLTLSLDSSSPSLKLVQAGATDQTLAVFRLDAVYEDVRLEQLGLQMATSTADSADQANASNSPSDLTKVTLWDGVTKVGEVVFTSDYATATLTGFTVGKDTSKLLTVKADVAPVNVTLSQAQPGHLVLVDWDGGWGDATDDDAAEGEQGLKGVGLSSGTTVYNGGDDNAVDTDTASNGARIVSAIPTVTKLSTSGKFTNTTDQTLYRFKVDAPAGTNGVSLYKFTFNVSTSTEAVGEYTGSADGETPLAVFKATNFRVYCFSDSSFSQGSCGNSTGLLNQYSLAIADGTNVDFEDGATTADPDVDIAVLFNPTASSGATAEAIRVPSGETRYFQLVADVTGASSTPNITTKLLGDSAWEEVACHDDLDNGLTVSVCDYTGPAAGSAATVYNSGEATFTAPASEIDSDDSADTGGDSLGGQEDFIWSDNATNSSQALGSPDWMNGFLLPGLPTVSTGAENLTF